MAKSTTMPTYFVELTGARRWYSKRVNGFCADRLEQTYPQCAAEIRALERNKHGAPTSMTKMLVRGYILAKYGQQAVKEGLATWDGGHLYWLADNRIGKALAGWSQERRVA